MAPVYDLMSSATRSLEMTMYELDDPNAEQILVSDAHRGVAVRVLLDEDYEGRSVNRATYEQLLAGGVAVRWANDREIFHQKTITVDDATSAIMTANLTSRYYPTTRDLVVIDRQPQDVAAIEHVFSEDFAGGEPSEALAGQDLVWSPGSEEALSSLIASATRSVICENEEMDSPYIESALEADARRRGGRDGRHDHQLLLPRRVSCSRSRGRAPRVISGYLLCPLHPCESHRRGQHAGVHRL